MIDAIEDWIGLRFGSDKDAYYVRNRAYVRWLFGRRLGELNGWRIVNRVLAISPCGEWVKR
jgi:hypothetical protein